VHSAEAWQNDPVARQCLKLAGEMPHAVASRCFAYLSLFRPAGAHQKSLQWKKVLRLLSELKELTTLPYIQWEKQVARPNSAHAWGMAMERMIEHPPKRLPLKSHGYLRAIAYELADEMDREAEVKRNQKEKKGNPHRRHSGEHRRRARRRKNVSRLVKTDDEYL
jgi:hypothetical protein